MSQPHLQLHSALLQLGLLQGADKLVAKGRFPAVLHHLRLPLVDHALEARDVRRDLPQQPDPNSRVSTPSTGQACHCNDRQEQLKLLPVVEEGESQPAPGALQEFWVAAHTLQVLAAGAGGEKACTQLVQFLLELLDLEQERLAL